MTAYVELLLLLWQMELPLLADVIASMLWQMELPLLADVIANMADGIAIPDTPSNVGGFGSITFSYTPEEAMSGGLAKACVTSKN